MIRITNNISIDPNDLDWQFVRSSGPGGQNVNKVASAVQLRFDPRKCRSIKPAVRKRLLAKAGSRATDEGEIIIDAREHRSQKANRDEALQRLIDLIRSAARRPKRRIATKPTRASKQRRLDKKKRRGEKKRRRRQRPPEY